MPSITTRFGPTVVNVGGTQLIGPAWATGDLRFLLPGDDEEPLPSAGQVALDAQAAQDRGNAAAETAKAEGLAQEADAYRIAAGIAGTSADLEQQATAITRYQQQRQVKATLAGQRADVAAAGFKESGSALSLLRESVSQGAITDALTRVQGNINASGYLAQQAAATGEQAAATASSEAAKALAKQYADAGVLATSLSANLAAELKASDSLNNLFGPSFGGGGNVGINVRGGTSGGRDPFLEGTLTNPAYTGGYGGPTGIGTGTVGTPGMGTNTAGVGGAQSFGGGGGQGTGGETIGPQGTPSWVDPSLQTSLAVTGDYGSDIE